MEMHAGFSSAVISQYAAEAVSPVALAAKILLVHMACHCWLFRFLHPHLSRQRKRSRCRQVEFPKLAGLFLGSLRNKPLLRE